MNKSQLQAYLTAGMSGNNPYGEADAKQGLEKKKLQDYLKVIQSPEMQSQINQGGSAHVGEGGISVGADPYAHMLAKGPQQAASFLKSAQGSYKEINNQLDAAKATVDSLNVGNAASDKLALINEARLAAGMGGSRAIKSIMDTLTGGKTAASNFQDTLNYFQNTPNIPTMQPAQRDALREAVFTRIPQVEQLHKQTSQQLMQQGPIIAPQADSGTIIKSLTGPAQEKLDQLKQMQGEYSAARSKMNSNPISSPSTANENPTTLDRLKSLFSGGAAPSPSKPQAPQQVAPDHAAAAAWAKANPNHPLAKQIMQVQQQQAPGAQ